MLDEEPNNRPTAEDAVMSLSYIDGLRKETALPLHRPCCIPIVGKIHQIHTIVFSDKVGKEPLTEAVETSHNTTKKAPHLDKQESGSTESTPLPPMKRPDVGNGQNFPPENRRFSEDTNTSDREEPRKQEPPSLNRSFNSPPTTQVRPPTSQSRRDLDLDYSRVSENTIHPKPVPPIPHANYPRQPETLERSDSSGSHLASNISERIPFMHTARQHLHNTAEPDDAPPVYEPATQPYMYRAS